MPKKKIKEIVEYLKILLQKRGLEINKIILFGSYAKGNYKKDSDIDIVIISKSFRRKGIFERAEMLGNLEWELIDKYLFPFDIITMSPEDFNRGVSLVSQYARDGEVIYEK